MHNLTEYKPRELVQILMAYTECELMDEKFLKMFE